MDFDIFLSIAQTPVEEHTPDENTMFSNFFEQLKVADKLGFGTAWVAQAHLSTEVQKMNKHPVVPHWEGEVGLCTDFFQLAHLNFYLQKIYYIPFAVISVKIAKLKGVLF